MTLRWLALDALEPHPENANRMSPDLLAKLKGHIERTGRYEPLIVRPMAATLSREPKASASARPPVAAGRRYQILNGHHRAQSLRELGHRRARCDVWEVGDEEARVLLATLNRLQGRDDPKARALLAAHLAEGRSAKDLARLLPEPADAVERLLRLASPPPAPAAPDSLEPLPQALTFFLSEEQHALVSEALKAVGETARGAVGGGEGALAGKPPVPPRERSFEPPALRAAKGAPRETVRADSARLGRAERLERLALWYLESVGQR
ncbi:MAG TPA: ParB/RepB/Spo0J family partition protein [Phycisphaerae bacterium]|nr:ParB/RepB/Spo0J family partition protein [Phycisphaerae bacterium]